MRSIHQTCCSLSTGYFKAAAFAILLAAFANPTFSGAQQGSATTPDAVSSLVNSQSPNAEEYILGAGDQINIDFVGHGDLSGMQVIGPDGSITLPNVGQVKLGDLTRTQAVEKLKTLLAKYYEDPSVTIGVITYNSNTVLLLGSIEHPGLVTFQRQPSLLEAISHGGNYVGVDKNKRLPSHFFIYRGNTAFGEVQMADILRIGDIRLQRNDIIYVPNDSERFISVLGQVQTPGPVVLKEKTTVTSALAEVGGLVEKTGNPLIYIYSPGVKDGKGGNVKRVLHLKDALVSDAKQLSLAPGDVIYVPPSTWAKTGFILQEFSPLAQIGMVLAYAVNR